MFNNRNNDTTSLLIATMNRLEEGQSQLKETVEALHRELISVELKIGDVQRIGTRLESVETRVSQVEQCESGNLLALREKVFALEKLVFKLENAIEVNSHYWDDFHLQQTQVVAVFSAVQAVSSFRSTALVNMIMGLPAGDVPNTITVWNETMSMIDAASLSADFNAIEAAAVINHIPIAISSAGVISMR